MTDTLQQLCRVTDQALVAEIRASLANLNACIIVAVDRGLVPHVTIETTVTPRQRMCAAVSCRLLRAVG